MKPNEPDELDRLYDRIELANPPPNFTGRVLARVQELRRIQSISAAVSLVGLALLGMFAFVLGRGLTFSGALDYLALLLGNLDVAGSMADDFAAALLDAVPWGDVIAVGAGILAVWCAVVVLPRWLAAQGAKAG
ncbi:MAG: hypothetical protein HZB53_16910 [Chloroflexi bacterium]|nr:hypothetical protein [Chloroflexota bacterium]